MGEQQELNLRAAISPSMAAALARTWGRIYNVKSKSAGPMDAFGRGGTRVGAGAPNPTSGVRGLGAVASILHPWRSTQLSPFLLKSPLQLRYGSSQLWSL